MSSRNCATSYKLEKTVSADESRSVKFKGLKTGKSYKAKVRPWKTVKGKKKYMGTSPAVHAFAGGSSKKRTNTETVTADVEKLKLKVGEDYTLSIETELTNPELDPEVHVRELRYYTTDRNVATVSSKGVIEAKGVGTCKVYILASNGVRTHVWVTVKN